MSDWGQPILTRLREILGDRFSKDDLKTLCFDLSMEYDDLPGEGRSSKARELISYCHRHCRLRHLVDAGKRQRPDIEWDRLLLRITIDTTILVNAFQKSRYYWDGRILARVADIAATRGSYLRICLDMDGWIRKEYFERLADQRDFQIWFNEIANNVDSIEVRDLPSAPAALQICDNVDRAVIAVAYQTDRILLTDDQNMGKGSGENGSRNLEVLNYLTRTLELLVCDAEEARSLLSTQLL